MQGCCGCGNVVQSRLHLLAGGTLQCLAFQARPAGGAGRGTDQQTPTHATLPPPYPLQLKPGASDVHLLAALHPTPAVCGRPREDALGFLAASEPFDRGYYAGPFGWVSQGAAEFVVAIRSALVRQEATDAPTDAGAAEAAAAAAAAGQLSERLASHAAAGPGPRSSSGAGVPASWSALSAAGAAALAPAGASSSSGGTLVSLFAGVGIVRGSDTASEWAELDLKIRQYERLLQGVPPLAASPNVNALWARLLVEELCRLGCNTFCVAPGEPGLSLGIWCRGRLWCCALQQSMQPSHRLGPMHATGAVAHLTTCFCPTRLAAVGHLTALCCPTHPCPAGSRSSPLTVAVAQHPRARIVPCIGQSGTGMEQGCKLLEQGC